MQTTTASDLAALDAALARDALAQARAERRRAAVQQAQDTLTYCRDVIGHNRGKQARARACDRIDSVMSQLGEALL